MMGPKQEAQAALFHEFSLEDHVSQDHLLRLVLSRNCAAPLTAYYAQKEIDYWNETYSRI